jgi:hypothetical protein
MSAVDDVVNFIYKQVYSCLTVNSLKQIISKIKHNLRNYHNGLDLN